MERVIRKFEREVVNWHEGRHGISVAHLGTRQNTQKYLHFPQLENSIIEKEKGKKRNLTQTQVENTNSKCISHARIHFPTKKTMKTHRFSENMNGTLGNPSSHVVGEEFHPLHNAASNLLTKSISTTSVKSDHFTSFF
jgi:hypothetical protein